MEKPNYVLAGDIGGTKTNLGLFLRGQKKPRLKILRSYPSREAPDLEKIIETFLELVPVSIAGACIGIAGPVIKGTSQVTNLPWCVSEERLQKQFHWPRARLINDLTATAFAIPLLTRQEVFSLGRRRIRSKENKALVAPGTGFGEALIIYVNGRYIPVPSEGGHSDFSPNTEDECELWRFLHRQYGHVSIERLLTGSGLYNIYRWLTATKRFQTTTWPRQRLCRLDPAQSITAGALIDRDPQCIAAIEMFVSIFGAVAGNLALTGMATGGVYLGGGIPPKILPMLKKGLFMMAFVNKGRLKPLLEKIAVRVILNDKAALFGAAKAAFDMVG
jgi:glucokinase